MLCDPPLTSTDAWNGLPRDPLNACEGLLRLAHSLHSQWKNGLLSTSGLRSAAPWSRPPVYRKVYGVPESAGLQNGLVVNHLLLYPYGRGRQGMILPCWPLEMLHARPCRISRPSCRRPARSLPPWTEASRLLCCRGIAERNYPVDSPARPVALFTYKHT
jgi:hypothetical protein